jgi:hypothetical protein
MNRHALAMIWLSGAFAATADAQLTVAGAAPAGATVIDFDALAHGTQVTTQFAALGVTIGGGVCAANTLFAGGGREVNNFLTAGPGCGGAPPFPGITFSFTTPIRYFGLNVSTSDVGGGALVTTPVGSVSFPGTGFPDFPFVAVQSETPFSSVTLSTGGTGAVAIDNMTFSIGAATTIPEPSTWTLLGTGLLAVGSAASRRRKRSAT